MTIAEKIYTVEEFMALPDDGNRYALLEGRLISTSPASGMHGVISATVVEYLRAYARPRKLGHVFSGATSFIIRPGANVLCPDAAFIVRGRIPWPLPLDAAVPVPPDLAVEVLSAHDYDHPGEFKRKLATYHNHVRLIWVIDPRQSRVEIYRLNDVKPALSAGNTDNLSGEDVLPGFTITVRDLLEPDS